MSKFDGALSERLYERSMEQGYDEEVVADGLGWYAIFRDDMAILNQTDHGFVYANQFNTVEALEEAWRSICAKLNSTCNDCGVELPEYGMSLCDNCTDE